MEVEIKKPFFSIITPIYNRAVCVKKAIDSVLSQSFKDWELILVDDGSSDGSSLIIDEVSSLDERIVAIHHESNQGVSAARNSALERAKGDYYLFLDSDDSFDCGMFAFLHDVILHKKSDLIICGIRRFGESSQASIDESDIREFDYESIRRDLLPVFLEVQPSVDSFETRCVMWNKCYRAALFRDNQILFDTNKRTWEDREVCIKVIDKATSVCFTNNSLVVDRVHEVTDHLSKAFYERGCLDALNMFKWKVLLFGNEYEFLNRYSVETHYNEIRYWIDRTLAMGMPNYKSIVQSVYFDDYYRLLVINKEANGVFEMLTKVFMRCRLPRLSMVLLLFQTRINKSRERKLIG